MSAFVKGFVMIAVWPLPVDARTVAAGAGLTVMELLVAERELPESFTVSVWEPAVLSVTAKVPTPAERFKVPLGKIALLSVDVSVTGPVYKVAVVEPLSE